jgi:hypothetical protein
MMRDSVKEFVDKELWAQDRFEKKDYAYTEESMRKAGETFFRSCSSRSLWRIRNGIRVDNVSLRLYFWGNRFILDCFWCTHWNWNYANYFVVRKNKKNMFQNLLQVSGLVRIV